MGPNDFEALRARLLHAQRAENAATRALNDFSLTGERDPDKFQHLLDAAHAAREEAVAAYEQWSQAVRASQIQR